MHPYEMICEEFSVPRAARHTHPPMPQADLGSTIEMQPRNNEVTHGSVTFSAIEVATAASTMSKR